MKSFKLILIGAERLYYNGPCTSLTIPGPDGEQGILADHTPMVTAVVPGELRFTHEDGTVETVVVSQGFAQVNRADVVVLSETVERPEEIDANRARQNYEDAQEALRQQLSQREYRLNQAALARAISELKVNTVRY
jgi:F-type H+-transporting ATPase subunit epsilon